MRTWEDLIERSFDRIRGHVILFRFPGGETIKARDHEDATSVAYSRAYRMGENFRGRSAGEFRAALKTTVWNACMDWGRNNMAYEMGIGGSLDERLDGGEASPYDGALARYYDEADAAERDVEDFEERMQADTKFFRWGIGQIENEKYRAVLELTFIRGLSGDAIAAQLNITPDNVYQRRRRGLQTLEKILRDHRP